MELSMPNSKPGRCGKCKGTGVFIRAGKEGKCFSCRGAGQQTPRQIMRNHAYNRHKVNAA